MVELALFGSFARDEATDASDVDILVRFDGPATSRSYFGVQFYLEDLLGTAGGYGDRQGAAVGVPALRGAGSRGCLTTGLERGCDRCRRTRRSQPLSRLRIESF